MLLQLRIENLVLAREVLLDFSPGLNLITGETGGGKSLLVGALALALGSRGEAGLVRQGADRAVVEALFDLSGRDDVAQRCTGSGHDPDDGKLVIRREVSPEGRSRAFLNGSPVTLSMLKEVTAELVELHGQHEPQTLLQAESHRAILDQYGRLKKLREKVRAPAASVRELGARLKEIEERAAARDARLELLQFRLAEFDQIRPETGEEEQLLIRRERLRHSEAIGEALGGALELIYEGEEAAVDRVHAAARRLRAQAVHDPGFEELAERLDDVRAQLADLAVEVRSGLEDVEPDPSRLAEVEDRLHDLERLRRRFDGVPLSAVITAAEGMRQEVSGLDEQKDSVSELASERETRLAEYRGAAVRLSAARSKAAGKLSEHVGSLLAELAMAEALLEVSIESANADTVEAADVCPDGVDQVELLLQANPGEPARPLRKVASGGELSRVMLALDVALESGLPPRTLLFDEVDQGLGGDAADRLGEFLGRVSAHHQVICITHLPQVAARADVHVTVNKKVKSGRTIAVVKTLHDEDQRVEEIARMLGGSFVTDTARIHAEELIRGHETRGGRESPRRPRTSP